MTEPREHPTEPHPGRPSGRADLVLAAATFVVVLDLAGVVILLPSIQGDLDASIAGGTWVVAVFVIAMATTLALGARFVGARGGRRALLLGMGTFALGSVVAALAPTLAVLLLARGVQGVGVALVEPAVRAVLRASGDDGRGGRTQGVAALLAAALGPVLPAALATFLSWRAQFWLDAAIGAAVVVAAGRLPRVAPSVRRRVSAGDAILTALALVAAAGAFVVAIEGPGRGWTSAPIVAAAAAAVVGSGVFVAVALRRREPLVGLRLLGNRPFVVGGTVRALTELASLGVFLALSGYLQDQQGRSPIIAGLLLMAIIVGALFTAPVAERLGERADPRRFLVPGFLVTGGGIFWAAHLTPTTPGWFVLAPLAVAGAGIGLLESPADLTIRRATPTDAADAGWLVSRALYLWGIGAGVAVVSATWQSVGVRTAAGVNAALLVCAAAAVVGAVLAALLPAHTASARPGEGTADV